MTNFTVRVELHDAEDEDYETLHEKMAEKGFVRWVKDGEGNKSKLPTAEYNMQDSNLKRSDILNRAKAAADAAKPKPAPWIIVTESAGRSWTGLKDWKG
jgi:hypothetical protein